MYYRRKLLNNIPLPRKFQSTAYFLWYLFYVPVFSALWRHSYLHWSSHSFLLPLCFLCIANFPHGHLYTLKPIWLFRLSFLKCPQLVDDKIQRNRDQQIYNRRNRFAYAEERNLYPKQNIRKDRRAAVADICFSKAFQFTAPIVCIPGKHKLIVPKKGIGNAQNCSQNAAYHIQVWLIHKKI